MQEIYLDYNASTPVHPEILQDILYSMHTIFANPSSQHKSGKSASLAITNARCNIARYISADANEIIFTSSATEAINLAIYSVLYQQKILNNKKKYKLLYAATEHKCVSNALNHWNKILQLDYEIVELPVNEDGQVILDILQEELPLALMLCTMAVNNETGIITNLKVIKDSINKHNKDVFWLVDSVQALGKIDIDFKGLGVSYASFSGHKIHAPKGCGVLYVKNKNPLFPMFCGEQENKYRAGTENVPAIIGFDKALMIIEKNKHLPKNLFKYRNMIINSLTKVFPNIQINNNYHTIVPTVINFSVPGFLSKELINIFGIFNIRVAAGSACGALNSKSYVIDAMNLGQQRAEGAIRMSFSIFANYNNIMQLCKRIALIGRELNNYKKIYETKRHQYLLHNQTPVIRFNYNGINSWIIINNEQCIVIDPIVELKDKLLNFITNNQLKTIAIMNTHGYVDYINYTQDLRNKLEVIIDSDDVDILGWPINEKYLCNINIEGMQYSALLLAQDNVIIKVPTPGYTNDSVSFIVAKARDGVLLESQFVFTGGNILIEDLGRANFKISNVNKLYESIENILKLVDNNCIICPTYDCKNLFATTMKVEQKANSLIANVLLKQQDIFLSRTKEVDLFSEERYFQEIATKVYEPKNCIISNVDAKDIINKEKYLLIDTREAIIHANDVKIKQLSKIIGVNKNSFFNVPFIHIANFMSYCINSFDTNMHLLFICNSGLTSVYVASAFRRLGFINSNSISLEILEEFNSDAENNYEIYV